MSKIKKFINYQLKRTWLYLRKFWKILAIATCGIILVIAVKIVPFLFIDFTPPPIPVATAIAVEEVWHKNLPAIGSLEAVQAVTIAPENEGRVTAIHFSAGQTVKAGDPIIQLNDAKEQADLKRYEAQLAYAEATLERSKKLVKSSFESKADLDQKSATALESSAQVMQAKAVIDKKDVRAPFDGVLGIRQIDLGQYLQPGTAIVSLTNAKKLFVNFTRPESDQAIISIGQKVMVKVDAFPEQGFEAIVTAIEPQVSTETRTIQIQATLDNDDLLLVPGMFASLKLILPAKQPVIVVPETAIDFSLYGDSVYAVVTQDGKNDKQKMVIKRHYVKVGDHQDGKVAILEGIKAGDIIVATGQLKLNDGTAVVIDKQATSLTPPKKLTVY